jgi:predicted RNA polymerase sigma factor
MNEGLAWVDKAMSNESFWNYELKALLLHKLGRTAEAVPLMAKAKELAAGKAPAEYIQGLDKTVASWNVK